MKKVVLSICVLFIIIISTVIAYEGNYEIANNINIFYNAELLQHEYPLVSYNGITYISVRDVGRLLLRNVRWEDKYNQIYLDSQKQQAIMQNETAEKIGKAIVEEFYGDRLTGSTKYYTTYIGRNLNFNDIFSVRVLFEPKIDQQIDDLYMMTNCDIHIDIDASDGSVIICELQEDGSSKEYSLLEIAERKRDK